MTLLSQRIFLKITFQALKVLHKKKKENNNYNRSKAIASENMKVDRMPFGLIDFNCKFFSRLNAGKMRIHLISLKCFEVISVML